MGDSTSQDDATKARILKHLNADHQQSLTYYLRHYAGLSSSAARAPTLVDITYSSMKFHTRDGRTHTIPITPPMKSWSEARTRTVEMDRESRAALGISDIRITEYEPPRTAFHRFVLFAVCFYFSLWSTTWYWTVPGTVAYDKILPYFPGGPEMLRWLVKHIFAPTVAIHVTECWWLDRTRLRKYGVERGSGLWVKWIVSCFFEGFGCFVRIDERVKRKRAEAEKLKH